VTRVLLVHQPFDGGVGRHLTDLASGLAEQGHEVVLCGPELPRALPRNHPHRRLELRRAVAPRADLAALARFTAIVREVNPDLIHAHSSKAGAIARLGRLARPRTPVLYTPHGYAFAGHFSRELERRAYREIERALAPLASRVVCVCEAEGRLARAVGPADRVRIVHNGIEPAGDCPTDPRMLDLARRGAVLCALTQLRPGKGLETLLDALPTVLAGHPRLQDAIWGEGPDEGALRARARSLGVEEAVHFLGGCDRPLEVLRGSQIFVHPSLAESFPYTILEAMAVGLPIVASDVGGIGEALLDGEQGLLTAPGDRYALARALIQLLDDPARAARMGDSARARLRERFTRAGMIDRLIGVYEELLTPANRRS
jgi:glycosyltransferase involved in cell wall biosynthesis